MLSFWFYDPQTKWKTGCKLISLVETASLVDLFDFSNAMSIIGYFSAGPQSKMVEVGKFDETLETGSLKAEQL